MSANNFEGFLLYDADGINKYRIDKKKTIPSIAYSFNELWRGGFTHVSFTLAYTNIKCK